MWATRLWKRGEKGERFEGMCEDTGQATRLRKSGKKRGHASACMYCMGSWAKSRGTCEGTGWATRLRKRGQRNKEDLRARRKFER